VSQVRVQRWRIGLVGALGLLAVGLLYASPLLVVATAIPLSYLLYGSVSAVAPDSDIAFERRFDDRAPPPGDRTTVTLTVENTGAATLTDCRVVDGVPEELAVVGGSPRTGVSLRPGETTTITYDVVAKRGEYDFADPVVRLRSLSGGQTVTRVVPADGDTTLSCVNPLTDAPLRNTTLLRAGTHPADTGGEGLEFRSTREYQPGDSLSRINWRGYAKTGELTTVSFREERAIRTVLVVDARPNGRVTPRPGNPTGTELCSYAGERLYETLRAADVSTSVSAVGLDDDSDVPVGPAGIAWASGDASDADSLARQVFAAVQSDAADPTAETPANDGREATAAAAYRLTGHSTADAYGGSVTRSDAAGSVDETAPTDDTTASATDGGTAREGPPTAEVLLAQFPPTAQVVFVTPLLDDWPVAFARMLHQRGYPLTLVSPNVTGTATLGQRVLDIERDLRLRDAETAGATTVSWDVDDPIDVALSQSLTHLLGQR